MNSSANNSSAYASDFDNTIITGWDQTDPQQWEPPEAVEDTLYSMLVGNNFLNNEIQETMSPSQTFYPSLLQGGDQPDYGDTSSKPTQDLSPQRSTRVMVQDPNLLSENDIFNMPQLRRPYQPRANMLSAPTQTQYNEICQLPEIAVQHSTLMLEHFSTDANMVQHIPSRTVTPAPATYYTLRSVPRVASQNNYPISELEGDGYGGAKKGSQFYSSLISSGKDTPYINNLLGMFPDPKVPLQIIDRFFSNTLPAALVAKLASALNGKGGFQPTALIDRLQNVQNERRVDNQITEILQPLPAPSRYAQPPSHASGNSTPRSVIQPYRPGPHERHLVAPQQTPLSRSGTSTPACKIPKNKRAEKNKKFESNYDSLSKRPSSWSPIDNNLSRKKSGPAVFEYTIKGELAPGRRYTVKEIGDYIAQHPLHDIVGPRHSGLKLWIQNTPADSRFRYPTQDSSKCRFENCPTSKGTIRTGEFRVCFQEDWSPEENLNLDPYHNAGYVHLYCLEKNFNFFDLCRNFNVAADTRKLLGESNNYLCMAITRDRESMLQVWWDYLNRDPSEMKRETKEDEENFFEKSLTRALTKHHVENESNQIRRQRTYRAGFDLSQHLGDLDKRARHAKKVAESKRNGVVAPKNRSRVGSDGEPTPKRKRRPGHAQASPDGGSRRRSLRLSGSTSPPLQQLRLSSRNSTVPSSPSLIRPQLSPFLGRKSPRLAKRRTTEDFEGDFGDFGDFGDLFGDEDEESEYEDGASSSSKKRKY